MKQKKSSSIFVYLMLFALIAFSVSAAQPAVDLGTAGNYVILAKSGISTTGTTLITGNIGVSPIDQTALTGFSETMDASNVFSTSDYVVGKLYAADYAPPTPTIMTTAVSDMETAYTDAAGRTETSIITELGAGDLSGMTLAPGLYKWGTGVLINNGVTLSGSANDVWIFQIAEDLTIGNGAIITLSNGAQAKNIFWQVGGQATLGTTSDVKGIILSQTAIAINTGAKLNGRALAQTAVTLDANAVIAPTGSATPTPSPVVSTPTNENNENNENSNSNVGNVEDQGIGQELNEQISVAREEIRSGNYESSQGQLLRVSELAQDLRELRVNGVTAQTDLKITAEKDAAGKTILRTKLRNGTEMEIKIMPDTASARALERLGLKVCSAENNCTLQLKDVGNGETERIQYEVQLERHSKILGLFQKKMQVSASVNAETGETNVHKPWWAFLAQEQVE